MSKRAGALFLLVAGVGPLFGARSVRAAAPQQAPPASTPQQAPPAPPPQQASPSYPPSYPPPPGAPPPAAAQPQEPSPYPPSYPAPPGPPTYYPPPYYAPPYYPPPRLAEPMALVPTGPRVTLRADNQNVRLEHLGRVHWDTVCTTPCGFNVDPNGVYRIGGTTIRKSDSFQLPRASGDVLVDVQAGSNTKHFVGLGLMIGGAVAAGYGTFFWFVFHTSAQDNNYPGSSGASDNRTAWEVAIFFGALTAVLEGIGGALWSSSTSVQVH